MHVIFRESHGLEDGAAPQDLGQEPGDLVVLSFSDSDLGAFAEGWHRGSGQAEMPTLRLANLSALKHPLSVDTYLERTLAGAKGILIRLIGGLPYWDYGIRQVAALAEKNGIALAVLPADGRPDPSLDAVSTLPVSTLRRLTHLCDTGGPVAAQAVLAQLALAAGLYAKPVTGAKAVPEVGYWSDLEGLSCPAMLLTPGTAQRVAVVFYRSYFMAADLAPITAIFEALRAAGLCPFGLFIPSLKLPAAAGWIARQLRAFGPAAVVNATAFSGKGANGISPLDAANVPVFQIALANSSRAAWENAERGLSPADLAMHVVLPEVDGRIFAGVASFKDAAPRDPSLQFARLMHRPDPERISAIARKVRNWVTLAATPPKERKAALVLSTYPGKGWNMAHAMGLDAIASTNAMLEDLQTAGHNTAPVPGLAARLSADRLRFALADYERAFDALPQTLRDAVTTTWGDAGDDPLILNEAFEFPALRSGNMVVTLQPERSVFNRRDDDYHDLSRVPRHGYVAFYLWLQQQAQAIIHVGAHGTLEWLPGKSVALGANCTPEALTGNLPVIYPFIVNDPGEAAQAKRRIGAVTLGHIPPPLRESETPQNLSRLEALLDEFSNADGLDPRRRDRLQLDIREEAAARGVAHDLGIGAEMEAAEAITRIDRFVCDIKESQFGDGLHIWGRAGDAVNSFDAAPSLTAERMALPAALNGERIASGPAGSPYRGRHDVLPTGRNLFATDPRAVPSRAAFAQGKRLADELLRAHLQDHGDWPKGLIVDLWGSATMRTAGEEFAMALHLIGVKPIWADGSERVTGYEITPIAEMDHPRIDVTLRVSGLFRDVFPDLGALFSQAVASLGDRDEAPDWNPYVRASGARVYGPAPGNYGLGMTPHLDDYSDEGRRRAAEAWLNASSYALDTEDAREDHDGMRQRVTAADAFVHLQDLPETDLLLAADYAAHEAGFAAAKAALGGQAALYHLDATRPERPRARGLSEEIARVVQARATNPHWLSGMRRHGFRGAAEIAATLEHMAAFAHLAGAVAPHLFDLYHEVTLGDPTLVAFMQEANPEALAAMRDRFAALYNAGLWQTRRNSVIAGLESAR